MGIAAGGPERSGPQLVEVDPTTGGPTTGHGGVGSDLDQAIAVLRARVDEEFRVSERLDSKARQAFALSSLFFGVIQAVTFGAFAEDSIHGAERFLLLAAAVAAGLSLVVVAHTLTNGEDLLEEADLEPESIVRWCEEAGSDPEYVKVRLVRELGDIARARADNNKIRARNYDAVATATRWSLIFSGVELLTAVIVRV